MRSSHLCISKMGDVSQRKRRRHLAGIIENVEAALDDGSFNLSSDGESAFDKITRSPVNEAIVMVENVEGNLAEAVHVEHELFDDGDSYVSFSDLNFDDSRFSDSSNESSDLGDFNEIFEVEDESFDNGEGEPSFQQELASWVLKHGLQHNKVDDLLTLLCDRFPGENLPRSCRTLLKTPRKVELVEMHPGKYFHFGLFKGISKIFTNFSRLIEYFDIFIHFDGLPLFKSTNVEMWPILCRIKTERDGFSQVFCVGSYVGCGKPSDSNNYLSILVEELKDLLNEGIEVGDRKLFVRQIAFICDAPAKSYVKKTIDHGGYSSCHKCFVVGVYIISERSRQLSRNPRGKVKYLDLKARLRTYQTFWGQDDEGHHRGVTILEELSIDLVRDFPLDFLHLCCVGVDKQLLSLLTQPSQYELSPAKIKMLDSNFLSLKDYCPRDFPRKQRSASESARWKASEHSKCFCYTGIVAYENVLSPEQYNHYLTFSVAMRIMCSEELCTDFADYACDLLKNFVLNSVNLYGESFVGFNVHGLIHLAEDVKRYGSLYNFSSFPFESYLNVLKKKLGKVTSH